MRLVIDAQGIQSQSRFRGIGRYTRGLVEGLARNAGEHEVWLALSANRAESVDDIRAHFSDLIPPERIVQYKVFDDVAYEPSDNDGRRAASELIREHFLASLEPDIILFSSLFEGFNDSVVTSTGPTLGSAIKAAIFYDLIPMSCPERYLGIDRVRKWYADKILALKQADLFFAISASAGREIVDLLQVDDSRVVNIMTAADDFAKGTGGPDTLTARRGINRPFFFYTASFEARKNFDRLIEAFGQISIQLKKSHQLILATSPDYHGREILNAMIREAGLEPQDVIVTGHITDDELKVLYSSCAVFVFPSIHEGFGLPVLEAMHCGALVIGSNISSISEVIGLEEAMFDPLSTASIAELMLRAAADQEFAERLRVNGAQRRLLFTWDQSAECAWQALDEAIQRSAHVGRSQPAKSQRYHALIEKLKFVSPLSDEERRILANLIAENFDTLAGIPSATDEKRAPVWRIEGPFDSTYSLSLLNRETARALQVAGDDVVLHSTEGPGDFAPNREFLAHSHPEVLRIYDEGADIDIAHRPLFVSRNLYPPRVNDMAGERNFLHHYGWEESRLPTAWVDQFNLYLDGITCLSSHVMKLLRDSGVTLPMAVSGCGVDHWERVQPTTGRLFPGKGFRLLHVSSCFPRKGADCLLAAYGKAFRRDDDVTLIIKTFPNPHNEVESQLAAARAADPDYPDVVLIFEDLLDGDLKALYQWCQVLVAPSRAEGFGLPLAEAMLSGLPVITTNWSGQLDFCNDETAWLVDFEFMPAQSHFQLSHSVWAEPDIDHLASRLREVFKASEEERVRRASRGRDLLMADYTWERVVARMKEATAVWSEPTAKKKPRIGLVTTWNCPCGIAAHSQHLMDNFPVEVTIFGALNDDLSGPDAEGVCRTWFKDTRGASLDDLSAAISIRDIDTLIIQFNYNFHDFAALDAFMLAQKREGRTIIIILHSTVDPPDGPDKRCLSRLSQVLQVCDRILVHSYHDLNRLKALGLVNNATLFPLGIVDGPESIFLPRASTGDFTIGSYGFCLPHKGLLSLVRAFALMSKRDARLKLHLVNAEYPVDVSREHAAELRGEISELGLGRRIQFTSDFLSDAESAAQLRDCDLLVFPYELTGESASAAVRFGIASGRPVVTTRLPIFADLEKEVFQIEGHEPEGIAAELIRIVAHIRAGDDILHRKAVATRKWRDENSYGVLATRLLAIIYGLK